VTQPDLLPLPEPVPACLPDASVVVCSRNRPAFLAEVVNSILCGEEVPPELIIVDQSDTPNQRLADLRPPRACEIRYLRPGSIGLSRANNAGAAAARHEIIVFTHDDVLVAPGWYAALVSGLLSAGPRAVVCGRVLAGASEVAGSFVPVISTDGRPDVYVGRVGADVLYPMNLALYRAALREVGGFDERLGPGTPFPGAEDNDLGLRLLEAGFRIVHAPQAVVQHRAWRGDREFLPLRWTYGQAQGAFYVKYLSLRDGHMFGRLRWDLDRHLRRVPGRVLFGARRAALGDIVYVAGLLWGMAHWLLLNHRK